jgi:hypothetical protein
MRAIERYTGTARDVIMTLKPSDAYHGDALLLTEQGVYPVRGLLPLLSNPTEYVAIPLHFADLPKSLRSDVVYLQPFADVADAIRAPYGADTVYAIKTRTTNSTQSGRFGV